MRMLRGGALIAALVLGSCESGSSDEEPLSPGDLALPPPAEGEGFQMALDAVAMPGEELWLCQIGELPGHGSIDHVVSRQPEGVHHMDIMVLTLTGVRLEPGMYPCGPLYEQYPALMESGIFLYASQQAEQEITLPEGVAAMVPQNIVVMHEIHYVNTTDQPVDVWSRVNAYLAEDPESVRQGIWGFTVRDANITVPPREDHTEWTRCVMSQDVDLLFLSSHTHELGRSVEVRRFDGTTVESDTMYVNYDWHAPALLAFEEPVHIAAGTGFEFRCNYSNPRSEEVHWGFRAQDEMCQIALVFTPGVASASCDVVETSDGVLPEKE